VSWQRGCTNLPGGPTFRDDEYVNTAAFEAWNFYINVTGNVKIFRINRNEFFEYLFWILKEFSIDDASKVASIVWNFGDPASE
jgi:hypothetical protein